MESLLNSLAIGPYSHRDNFEVEGANETVDARVEKILSCVTGPYTRKLIG